MWLFVRFIPSLPVLNILLSKFLEINVSTRLQTYSWISWFRTSPDYADIYHCALGYWDSLIKEGTRCSKQINYIFHQWKIIVFPSNVVFQVEFTSANYRYLEAGCLQLVSQVYSYGRRNNTDKHFQLICLGCLFQGEMNCLQVMPDSFFLTMTKGNQDRQFKCLTCRHLRTGSLNLYNYTGQVGGRGTTPCLNGVYWSRALLDKKMQCLFKIV